jgi:hypothetical protein
MTDTTVWLITGAGRQKGRTLIEQADAHLDLSTGLDHDD